MYITDEEREIIMNEKYYVHLEEIKPNHFIYGVMGVINDTPFDYTIGRMNGVREEVIDKITKKTIEENKINLNKDVFIFKYDELKDAKTIERNIKIDDFYDNFRVSALPAVFLSDMNIVNILSKMVQKNAVQEQMILQSKYGFVR